MIQGKTNLKIVFSGGGTLGPVTPLLALHEIIRDAYPDAQYFWIGTKNGPEKALVDEQGIQYRVFAGGKFRRYLSVWNVVDLGRMFIGFWQSLFFLLRERPSLCISAGGFVSVPLHWAAWLLGVRTWVHQQDIEIGLANKLMIPFATIITTSMEKHLDELPKKTTHWLGNPVRRDLFSGDRERARAQFHLSSDLPVVFATGGGTGSLRVNQLVVESVQHLQGMCQIIHLSGKERPRELSERTHELFPHYQTYQFFTHEMKDAYAVADIVISRGGFGTIAEIAALGKAAILIPKPGHQEENVKFLAQQDAVVFVSEVTSDGLYLASQVKELLADQQKRLAMGERIKTILPVADGKKIIEILQRLT